MIVKPEISVIIINYNKPEITRDCVLSVIKHTQGCQSFEIVVVDNASTEGDISIIENLDARIKLIKSNINLGFSKGNNLGIANANGDVVLLLNNDTILINDAISICYDILIADKETGVVGCQLLNPDGSIQRSVEYFPTIKRLLKQMLRFHKFFDPVLCKMSYPMQTEHLIKVDWIWGTFYLFKKPLLASMPNQKLPDDFFMYAEDLQWGYEIAKLKLNFIYVPWARVYHLKSDNPFSKKMIKSNLYACLRKYKGNLYQLTYALFDRFNDYTTNFFKLLYKR
jgi:GT2 family glycosyltransferase